MTSENEISKKDRLKLLKKIAKKINKDVDSNEHTLHFGIEEYGRISTGIIGWDWILGGGLPKGKFVTIAGPEQTAKGTACAKCVANVQANGGVAGWIDAEQALDPEWMNTQGVKNDELFVIEKDTLENMLDQAIMIIREKLLDVLIIDSLGALLPRGEQEKKTGKYDRSMNDDTVGLLQRKMGQFLRLSCGPAAKTQTTIIMIGQIYANIGGYGSLELVKGGNAVKHFTHIRLKTRRGAKAEAPKSKILENGKEKEKEIGFAHYMKIGKTRQSGTAAEGSEIKYPFMFGTGFSDARFIADIGIQQGKIIKAGAHYKIGDLSFHGSEKLYQALEEDLSILGNIDDLNPLLLNTNSDTQTSEDEIINDEETENVETSSEESE